MKKLSNINKILIKAHNKGYYVLKDGSVKSLKNKILKEYKNDKGYKTFTLRLDKVRCTVHTHKLQAYQKYGDKMFGDNIVVRHLDGNSSNNSWDNIEIGTHQDNMQDIPKEVRLKKALIATSKVKIHDHKAILEDRNKGMTYKELMKKYEISSKGTISFIINKSYDKE